MRMWRLAAGALAAALVVPAIAYLAVPQAPVAEWAVLHAELVHRLGLAIAGTAGAGAVIVFVLVRQLRRNRRIEAELRDDRRSLERAQRVAHIGSWSGTWNGRMNWSAEVFRVFGVDPATWGGTWQDALALIHPEDVPRIEQARRDAAATCSPYSLDFRICRPDGALRWLHAEAELVRNAAGAIEVFGTVQDITEQKLAADALRLSEARFSDFAETASDWYWETGPDHRFTYMSERVRAFGLDERDWIGQRRFDRASDFADDADKWREHIAALDRHEPFRNFVYRTDGAGRRPMYITVSGKPLFDEAGKFLGYRGTGRDITAQIRAEEALRLSQTRLRDYAETASDWYWETGPDHRFTYMSSRIGAFGQDPQQRLGRRRQELACDVAEQPAKWRAHLAQLDRHEPFRDFVYAMKVAGEARMTLSVSGKPFFDSAGRFLGYRGTSRDITATIAAEAKLREAKGAAEAASAAKTAFLANMSHELRTPLNAIIGFAEALSGGYFGPMSEKQREYVKDIQESGQHLLLLISDLLDVAKIEAGKFELHRESVNVADEIAACLRLVQAKADEGGVSLATDVAANVGAHSVDRRALRQVLLNLLSNGIKFTPPGGRVVVGARRDRAGDLVLSITDTGVGIAPEDLAKIIVPFGALARNANLSRTREGTGLGLPLSKSLVELHGGRLDIESQVGRGTTATARFPAIGQAA